MPTIPLTLRLVKGSKLTFGELDQNFINLRDAINTTSNSDIFVTGGTYNSGTSEINFSGNNGFNPFGVDVSNLTYWASGSSGTNSIKVKNDSTTDATGDYAIAQGFNTLASGNTSHAEGYFSKALGATSHAEGSGTIASGEASHSEGVNTKATNQYTHAEGWGSIASGDTAHAEGYFTLAGGAYSHAEGRSTISDGRSSHAEGESVTASGDYSHAGGLNTIASGHTSFVHSINSIVSGDRSVILGGQNIIGTTNDTVYVPNLEINGQIIEKGEIEFSGSGTINLSAGTSIVYLKVIGVDSVVLPNGVEGQRLTMCVDLFEGTSTTITPNTALGYTNIVLDGLGESVQLLFSSGGWIVVGGNRFLLT